MKTFRIPCFILLAMLVLALFNSTWLSRRCADWEQRLDNVDQCVRLNDWDGARYQLQSLYEDWQSVQTYLHITIDHEELNAAQSLFHRSLVLCQEEDSAEFRPHLADLRSQLELLAEMERVSIKNVM